ncbi:Uu.00g143500.m01.CDS01 [Anthostomella pinea]|uniref:tripeptidyl-peptidase II n=1 Tax=Anthostomella pinea TaxID=933095 RepID=A0AAI8VRC0_9PEZI|nr:Uu.00g143500.m01.CDS01 [Anthostomella pinea]
MSFFKLSASLSAVGAILGASALPSASFASYAVKERHVVPQAWTESGAADKSQLLNLQIGLKQQNEGVVEQHLVEISDPNHQRYGNHLSASEVHDLVTPSDETVDAVRSWLHEHGISNHGLSPAKDWISVVVPIEKAEELLHTKYSTFVHKDGSTLNRAPEWSLPAHLHEHIDVVQPTTSFFRAKPEVKSGGPVTDGGEHWPMSWWEHTGKHLHPVNPAGINNSAHAEAVAAACNVSFTTLTCLRTLYGTLNYTVKAPKGTNNIAICNYLNETNKRSDIKTFLETFRPEAAAAAYEFPFVNIADAENYQGPNDTLLMEEDRDIEGNLDAELVLGISWPTPMTSYLTGGMPPFLPSVSTPTDSSEPYLTWLNYVVAQPSLPQVISSSYGDDEQSVPYSYAKRACAMFAQLGARGVSMLVSSGDAGVGTDGTCYLNKTDSYGFTPNFPTSCPWVTSVGGTANFNPETAVTRFASGGGFSNYFGAPAYQQSTVNAYIASLNGTYDGVYNKSGRAYPDVAAQGNNDAIVWAGILRTVGGTSASSPTFAAVIALVNDALIAAGKPALGFLNPWIYGGAYKALTDITIGSSYGCNTTGFPAQVGWDAVTGWGTPNFGELVRFAFAKEV